MKLVAKIVIIKVFCFLKWEFRSCEVCTGLMRRYRSSTHKNRFLSYILRLIISQEVWKKYLFSTNWTRYVNLQVFQLLIKMLPNSSILHGRIDNALFCRTLSFGSDPNFFMFPRRRKNKKRKIELFWMRFLSLFSSIVSSFNAPNWLSVTQALLRVSVLSHNNHCL